MFSCRKTPILPTTLLSTVIANAKVPFSFAPEHCKRQRAGAVGTLGLSYYKKGIFEPAQVHVPEYLRLSQAEREREQNKFVDDTFEVGQRVFHDKMGIGHITDVMTIGESIMYTIDFGKLGKKAMDASYAKLKKF